MCGGFKEWRRSSGTLEEDDQIEWYLERTYGLKNYKAIGKALNIVASQNHFHPIKEYLENLEWDGSSRIGNRRFAPITVHMESVEKHILEDERKSREYINLVWAEMMDFYRKNEARVPWNIVYIHKALQEVYEEIFGTAVSEYNAKQKRLMMTRGGGVPLRKTRKIIALG